MLRVAILDDWAGVALTSADWASLDGVAEVDVFARHLDEDEAAELLAAHVRRLADDVGVPRGLADLGVTEADVHQMSRTALDDACLTTNPREADEADVHRLFMDAL